MRSNREFYKNFTEIWVSGLQGYRIDPVETITWPCSGHRAKFNNSHAKPCDRADCPGCRPTK